ncbi:SAM-dependent methyltransferase [Nocardia brasiliensis]|uniref:SAM-dependent methyltransferase n=2 Tax=Nocardia brasiliensis TaxID=37326 RepID=UPI001F393BFC|nr:SAM-dependent methyltransferase [Nocardia brasiliensis]
MGACTVSRTSPYPARSRIMVRENDRLIRTDVPHSARIWNYWLGGQDFYEVDRIAGESGESVFPDIGTMARQSRRFLIRVVRHLAAEAGIRQFLDIGTGLPTMQNTHEVAQGVAPESKIVYVDNDPLVLAHARALLINTTDEGVTALVESDFHNPEQIVQEARNILNFNKPIAVMFMGVLGHARTWDDVIRITGALQDAIPSGSYFAMYEGTTEDQRLVRLSDYYAKTGAVPYYVRSVDQIREVFRNLELVEPGVVPVNQWHPDAAEPVEKPSAAWGGVGRKR